MALGRKKLIKYTPGMTLPKDKWVYLTDKKTPDNIITRAMSGKLTKEQSIRLALLRMDAANPNLPQKQRDALDKWIAHYESGRLGRRSDLFLRRGPIEARIGKLTQAEGQAIEQFPQVGSVGAIVYALGKYGARGYFVGRKRRDVLKAIDIYTEAKPGSFKALIFATARFLWQNNSMRGGVLYDREAEARIMEAFGKLAERSKSYMREQGKKQALVDYGQQYFRYLIRKDILPDFKFLLSHHVDPSRMKALRYALIGNGVDSAAEKTDVRRMDFITTIFEKDIPELSKLHDARKKGSRAFQALIRIRWKAMQALGTKEAVEFYYKICKYCGITTKQVDNYAFRVYYGVDKVMTTNNPPKEPLTQGQLERTEIDEMIADSRGLELKRRIEHIYGKDVLKRHVPKELRKSQQSAEKAKDGKSGSKDKGYLFTLPGFVKKAEKRKPRIVLSPTARFEKKHGNRKRLS